MYMQNFLIRQLDKLFTKIKKVTDPQIPSKGWLATIRKALGMTSKQFGGRLGITQQSAIAIEKREAEGKITIESLEKAAIALNCRLVYYIVPNEPLEQMLHKQIDKKSKELTEYVSHLMELEDQKVEEEDQKAQLIYKKNVLSSGKFSKIWEDK